MINPDLRELYQQVILDHNKNPKNFGKLEHPTHDAEGFNPLCGDHLHLYLVVNDGIVDDVKFEGSGCAISKSSASLMTEIIKGKSIGEVEKIFNRFHDMVTGNCSDTDTFEDLDKLAILQGVKEFPARVKCATLAWHTLEAAVRNDQKTITTE